MSEYERELGEMTAKIHHLETTVNEMSKDLREIRDTLLQAKGGWRTVMMVAGISAAIGGVMVKIVPLLSFAPR